MLQKTFLTDLQLSKASMSLKSQASSLIYRALKYFLSISFGPHSNLSKWTKEGINSAFKWKPPPKTTTTCSKCTVKKKLSENPGLWPPGPVLSAYWYSCAYFRLQNFGNSDSRIFILYQVAARMQKKSFLFFWRYIYQTLVNTHT